MNTLAPELIVKGDGAYLGAAYFEPMRDALREHAIGQSAEHLPVQIVPQIREGSTCWAQGAASLAVQRIFKTKTGWVKERADHTRG